LLFAGMPAAGTAKEMPTEKFRANTISAPRGRSTQVDILVRRWTTEEERAGLIGVLKENNPREFARALRDQEEVGWVQFRGQRSYRLRYSRSIVEGDKRMIILATDRPVAMLEATGGTQSMDFSVSLIVLQFEGDAEGVGQFSVGTEILFDETSNSLNVTNVGQEPLRLTNVRPIE
jgi:hypothetical protein